MKTLLIRIATAVVGIPLFLGAVYLGGPIFLALTLALAGIGFYEYQRILAQGGHTVSLALGLLGVGGALALTQVGEGWGGPAVSLFLILTMGWAVSRYPSVGFTDALLTVAGVFYIGFLMAHWLLLRGLGLWPTLLAFLCIWAADSGAYFIGRALGKHKLAPRLSPGKSIEGAVGGALVALGTGVLLAPLVPVAPWQGGLLGLLIGIVGPLGDLFESALKRQMGVKDSGSILPGHGGVLDRFDSSLLVVPTVYYVMTLMF